MEHVYDMVVVGGGPGGYTAALYAARAGLDTVVLEKLSAGGQMALTMQIDNYPGFEEGVDGFTLGEKMQVGAERFGVKTELVEVLSMDLAEPIKKIETDDGDFYGRTVVICTGANPRKLDVEGEEALVGRGVNYCAACDGMFYKGKTVAVIGGGNTAVADAMKSGKIGGFACDVYSCEPFSKEHPFYEIMEMDNVLLTPHMAWGSYEARVRLLDEVKENIKMFFEGKIKNIVDIKE